jgi:putative zinc-binding metallo-peptidase
MPRKKFAWASLPDEQLLKLRLKDLKVTVENTWLEDCLHNLHEELAERDIRVKPHAWISSEWFSPENTPGIAFPFYLAHPRLIALEKKKIIDVEGGTWSECMAILRHEAGHVLQHSYELHRRRRWQQLFGASSRRYPRYYRPNPASRHFVQHLRLWYAQSHPDEDFAETFAVWLTPRSNWRKKYRGWSGAMTKLRYVDRMARKFGDADPLRPLGRTDITVEEMETTVAEFYQQALVEPLSTQDLPLETDLVDIFKASRRRKKGVRPAVDLLRENRETIIDKVTYWTGVQRPLVKGLVEAIVSKVAELGSQAEVKAEKEHLTEVTVYATALAMNYLTRGKFSTE